jgi:exopolysaccharide production protein ExoZ
LQILRAVAALLVVYRHAVEIVRLHQSANQSHSYALDKFGACGVDIFFTISGFILSTVILRTAPETPAMAWDFLTRRWIRIFPIYWIVSIFFVVLAATHKLLTLEWTIDSYLLVPLTYPLRAPLLLFGWTLMFEIFFYYVIYLNLLISKKAAIPRTVACILWLVGMGTIIGIQRPILIVICNPMNIEFVLGCAIAWLYARFGTHPRLGTVLMLSGSLALATTVFLGYGRIDDAAFILNGAESWSRVLRWGLASAVVTAGFVFRPAEMRSPAGRFGVYLGDTSYSIYLTSTVTLFVANRYYAPIAALPAGLNISLLIFLVILVGTATYKWIERPIAKFLSRKYERQNSRRALQLASR